VSFAFAHTQRIHNIWAVDPGDDHAKRTDYTARPPLKTPAVPTSLSSEDATPKPAKVYTVGTLSYNQKQLVVLFFWLMWNDFSITLIESIGGVNGILMKNYGATFTQMAVLGSIGGFFNPWINPWVSTWSDRYRGRHGRRRPFLLVATPFFAFFLMAVPFMPEFYHWLLRVPGATPLLSHLPMNGEAFFIGVCGLISGIFNAVIMAIFQYLYWDVVPESHMGRFQSLSRTVTLIAGIVWGFFIFGYADHYPKVVYAGTGSFCLVVYMISTWQIKEGEYPPPDVHKKGGAAAPVLAYFVECFSEPYYLWVFFAEFLFQLGNLGGGYQFWFAYNDLNISLATQGRLGSLGTLITTGFGMLCGFAIGTFTDRLNAIRLMGPCFIIAAMLTLLQYFLVHDQWSWLYTGTLKGVFMFALGIVMGAYTVEIFPREKLGQFCSARAVFYQFPNLFLGVLVAMFFDHVHNNRLSYVWMAFFWFLSGLVYIKIHFNWNKRHGVTPVPHSG
jgi:MFS family permease